MSATITENYIVTYERLQCSECSLVYYVPDHFKSNKRENGNTFYCPNGHGQHFTESTQKKLERAEAEKVRLANLYRFEQDQRRAAEIARTAAEAATVRLKKRVAKG